MADLMVGEFELASAATVRRLREALLARLRLLAIYPICIAASLLAAWRMFYLIARDPDRAWTMAVAHDQLGNAALDGDPDETVSSRANRARAAGRRWGCLLCRALDWLDTNHCSDAAGV